MALITEKRGAVDQTETLDLAPRHADRPDLRWNWNTFVDFHDRIKSITHIGYGSMDYDHAGYRDSDMVKLDMLVDGRAP